MRSTPASVLQYLIPEHPVWLDVGVCLHTTSGATNFTPHILAGLGVLDTPHSQNQQ